MRYTKGEWLFDPNESEFSDKHYVFCPAGKTICSIFGLHNDPEDEANGNALLIAAAPELLEALQLLTDPLYLAGLNQSAEHHPFIKKARLVIAKATGQKERSRN